MFRDSSLREQTGIRSRRQRNNVRRYQTTSGSSHLVLNAIEGGSDTTRATLNLLVAAMATHPDFVQRARKELDSVCGDAGRLPTFEDQAKLPLVTAVIKETLRWKPFVESGILVSSVELTLGVVRVLIKDDHFENYYFPAGTRFSIVY